jgi:hypothetical protein
MGVQARLPRWFKSLERMESSGCRHADHIERTKSALVSGVVIELTGQPQTVKLANTPAVTKHLPMCLERAQYYVDIAALELLETARYLAATTRGLKDGP